LFASGIINSDSLMDRDPNVPSQFVRALSYF
jgi:hypothetical protein